MPTMFALIRSQCARIAAEARHVRIVEQAIGPYAAALERLPLHPPPAVDLPDADPETRAALHLTLDAVNFGSGWFPTLRKREGLSGYFTIALGIRDRGPWTAGELAEIDAAEVARTAGQDAGHELMELYASALRELGARVRDEHGGSFLALATRPRLAEELATWPTFADAPFYKRAQITAYDMVCAGLADAGSEGDLTIFADNLVPHVLRIDGLLDYDAHLLDRIDRGELLEHGSAEEIEIRACALHAVELLVAHRPDLSAPAIDAFLWHRGQAPRYKSRPRHRARCTAY